MSKQTLEIDFHGIPLTVSGRYSEAEPEGNCPAYFELESVKAGIFLAGEYHLGELHERGIDGSVMDFLEEEAIRVIEDGFDAAAEEAADARREARRDAELE